MALQNGHGLGGIPRAFDPRETRYARAGASGILDLSVERGVPVSAAQTVSVEDQWDTNACTGHGCSSGIEMLAAIQGLVLQLSRRQIYWDGRATQNWFGQGEGADTGAYTADVLDAALAGVGREEYAPWEPDRNVSQRPPQAVYDDAVGYDFFKSHRPFYASGNNGILGGLVEAFDLSEPVAITMEWRPGFNSAVILPLGAEMGGLAGYHLVCAYRMIPAHGSYPLLIVCRNSWGYYTSQQDVAQVWPHALAGDFYLQAEHLTNGVVTEARALSAEPVPEPAPPDDLAGQMYTAAHHSCDVLIDAVQHNPSDPEAWATLRGGEHVRNEVDRVYRAGGGQ